MEKNFITIEDGFILFLDPTWRGVTVRIGCSKKKTVAVIYTAENTRFFSFFHVLQGDIEYFPVRIQGYS